MLHIGILSTFCLYAKTERLTLTNCINFSLSFHECNVLNATHKANPVITAVITVAIAANHVPNAVHNAIVSEVFIYPS